MIAKGGGVEDITVGDCLELRLIEHECAKRPARLIGRGEAVVQSATVSWAGHRWYASVLCKVTTELPERPTRRQRERGRVGVDVGVRHLAVLSQPLEPTTKLRRSSPTRAMSGRPRTASPKRSELARPPATPGDRFVPTAPVCSQYVPERRLLTADGDERGRPLRQHDSARPLWS
ncbi:hypothetical protein ACIP2Y_43985 [Streptomyces sviceus]|uniref:hypothetical protein n=1 Tax=Streptomyces sviceus TaxID=285530 RepID=UPI0037F5CB62